jgi:hypothetical protein
MSDENWAHAMRRHDPPKKGKTPEAKVTAEIDRYLKLIGVINIRANAGSWADDQGNIIMGAKAGTSDKILCVAGRFVALEIKAAKGTQSEAQKKFQGRVTALGGLYILAHSKDEVRDALVTAFGAQAVQDWETLGRAREAAVRKAKRNI